MPRYVIAVEFDADDFHSAAMAMDDIEYEIKPHFDNIYVNYPKEAASSPQQSTPPAATVEEQA